ncbi:branched-chain-amino-acid transaminase [Candidatus Bathyarchaeota archaeon]|nr:branched-chain-amino-acid transaminase [Candidatus Bathyarchaeota archaeon]
MEKELLVYIDGKYYPKSQAKVSVYDHGLLYGDGVFEGIRVYDGIVFRLKEHIDRLYCSAHAIMLEIPMTKEEMIKTVLETLRKNNLKDAYIRLVITRGVGDLGLNPKKCAKPTIIIITDTISLHKSEAKEKGVTAMLSWVKRDPVDATSHEIKSLNYLNSILAKIEANISNVDEAICLDKNGFICEGVAENIFIIKRGKIFTPPSYTGALPGITAEAVMNLARKMGYEVKEKNITPYELFTANEVFFTGTATEIVPVREINKRTIGNGAPGVITKRLMAEFSKMVRDPEEGISIYK